MLPKSVFAVTACLTLASLAAQAQVVPFLEFQSGASLVSGNSLTGEVSYEGWNNLNTTRVPNPNATGGPSAGGATTRPYGSHNNPAAWSIWTWDGAGYVDSGTPATVVSNLGSGTSELWKSSGYGYLSGSALHQGVTTADLVAGGVFSISGSSIENLETLVFQMGATPRGGSIFWELPTLTIAGETYAADFTSFYDTVEGYVPATPPFSPAQDLALYAFQWDLSGLSIAEGQAFTIDWTGMGNSSIYGLQINQGDTFAQVVPEPTAAALALSGAFVMVLRRKRKG